MIPTCFQIIQLTFPTSLRRENFLLSHFTAWLVPLLLVSSQLGLIGSIRTQPARLTASQPPFVFVDQISRILCINVCFPPSLPPFSLSFSFVLVRLSFLRKAVYLHHFCHENFISLFSSIPAKFLPILQSRIHF